MELEPHRFPHEDLRNQECFVAVLGDQGVRDFELVNWFGLLSRARAKPRFCLCLPEEAKAAKTRRQEANEIEAGLRVVKRVPRILLAERRCSHPKRNGTFTSAVESIHRQKFNETHRSQVRRKTRLRASRIIEGWFGNPGVRKYVALAECRSGKWAVRCADPQASNSSEEGVRSSFRKNGRHRVVPGSQV